jgi:hypothetical protein
VRNTDSRAIVMAQITLDKAIALLSSEKLKERSDSLAGLSTAEPFNGNFADPTRFETHSPAE